MSTKQIVRKILRKIASDSRTSESDKAQAAVLLELISDRIPSEKPSRKIIPCEMSKAKCDSSLDQLWRNFEDRHYSDLKRISERGSLMMEEVNLAMACVQMLYAELTNRQSQRMIEDLIEKNQH